MSMNGQAAMQPLGTARPQTGWADVRPGVWLAGGLVLVFLLMSPKAFKRILQGAVMSALVLMVLSVAPAGQEIINLLPFVGQEEQGNIDYRADLLTVSMSVIERNLLFGSSDFLSAPELQVMKQGEGIIDIVTADRELQTIQGICQTLLQGRDIQTGKGLLRQLITHVAADAIAGLLFDRVVLGH